MAKDKKGFILYCDIIHTIEKLTDEQAGKLFKHILKYVNDQEPIPEDIITEIAFEPIKQSLKRDLQKYEDIRVKNKENALKRWNATASERMQVDTKNADRDRVIDKDIDIINYEALLQFINETFGREFKVINNKVRSKYVALLKQGYTKNQITNAILNSKKIKHHIENNFQYCTPEFFSRSEIIDKYGFEVQEVKEQFNLPHLR